METKKFNVLVPFVLNGEETSEGQVVELTEEQAVEFASSISPVEPTEE